MVTMEEGPEEEEKDESAPFSYDEPAGMYVYGSLRPGRKQVRSLLDNAAHQSYITQRVEISLKMRIIGSRNKVVGGFAGKRTTGRYNLFEGSISSLHGRTQFPSELTQRQQFAILSDTPLMVLG